MLTQSSIRSMVKGFQEANDKYKLRCGQKSSIYQAIIQDYQQRETKENVSKNRRNRAGHRRPSFAAPLAFDTIGRRKILVLWPCDMVEVKSSFISAVGYNKEFRVLKVTAGKYTYAYQDVPEAVYQGFLSAPSIGQYYNRVKKLYAVVALV